MSQTATWTQISHHEQLKRSSVCASAIQSTLYVFGGELKPRQPRDNDLHKLSLSKDGRYADIQTVPASNDSPSPRVGAATTALNGKVYMFSGRGGEAMAPIDEKGHLWVFDPAAHGWSTIPPATNAYPEARSYHCMTNDGTNSIYLHAGCPEKGRLSDLWVFNISKSEWTQLASAPDPPRGGPSITFVDGKVYRMNGFDGKTEQGGSIDVFDPAANTWSSITFSPDGKNGPGARSVSALLPVSIDGSTSLVTLFGESDPSSLGHQGAGKMLRDAWSYSLREKKWSQIDTGSQNTPEARGWFDADAVTLDGKDGVVVVGGLGESNDRLDDAWLLSFK